MRPDPSRTAASAGPHASVDPAKYYDLAIAHVRANGGVGVVVTERGTPAEWRAWLAYFAFLDGLTFPRGGKVATFRSMRNGVTVPAAWPRDFDLSAPPSPPWRPEAPATPERRRDLADMLRSLVAGITVADRHAPTWRGTSPAAAQSRLAELKDAFAADAPQVGTPDMAAYLARMRGDGVDDSAARGAP